VRAGGASPRHDQTVPDDGPGVNPMAVAQHLLPELYFGDGVFYALVVVLALIVGSRVYGSVRHVRGATERLLIVTADIFAWKPPRGSRYDVIWFDIWPDIAPARLPEMARLHRRFAPYLNRGNSRRWMDSWHRRETRRLVTAPPGPQAASMAETRR